MRKTRLNPIGKVTRRRQRGMKSAYPVICERAGGIWNGRYCEGARCELCGMRATDTAHILSRAQGGDEDVTNLIALCRGCHDLLDHGDAETRERMREKARRVTHGR